MYHSQYRTPLHCAAAYSNLAMISYLVESGSSLFLSTQDGDTPLQIALEEYEGQKNKQTSSDGEGENTATAATECWMYLSGRLYKHRHIATNMMSEL